MVSAFALLTVCACFASGAKSHACHTTNSCGDMTNHAWPAPDHSVPVRSHVRCCPA
jgi:hypothetical protein